MNSRFTPPLHAPPVSIPLSRNGRFRTRKKNIGSEKKNISKRTSEMEILLSPLEWRESVLPERVQERGSPAPGPANPVRAALRLPALKPIPAARSFRPPPHPQSGVTPGFASVSCKSIRSTPGSVLTIARCFFSFAWPFPPFYDVLSLFLFTTQSISHRSCTIPISIISPTHPPPALFPRVFFAISVSFSPENRI
ncbi:UNVERIFIED_CONTAM: hypothetical protein PYX00_001355 [Menopon gallinae]|uniref:Uncharacterized protein n=1 Tax=Menopon gallinae TaxID=328185 RepID=A0AAW2ICV9_9NEOP